MAFYAVGPIENGVIDIKQVVYAGFESDLPPVPDGFGRADVTDIATGVNDLVGRQYNTATSVLVPLPVGETVAEIRTRLKARYRELEAVPGLSAWANADNGRRARGYSRWVEMQAIASAVDGNLSNADNLFVLDREAAFDGRAWYWLYWLDGTMGTGGAGISWGPNPLNVNVDDFHPNIFYPTVNSDSTTVNSRGWTTTSNIRSQANISMAVPAGFNWIQYLGS